MIDGLEYKEYEKCMLYAVYPEHYNCGSCPFVTQCVQEDD